MKGYYRLRKAIMKKLYNELPEDCYYHGPEHTLDVLRSCKPYIVAEKVNKEEAKLLRIGVLFHDTGFTVSKFDHEDTSVRIARKMMAEFGFSKHQFQVVKGLILATRVPHRPKNKLQRIICDADLDYLGRPGYYKTSGLLYQELRTWSQIASEDEWIDRQISFLESHRYFTPFAIKNRRPQKLKRIEELKTLRMNRERFKNAQ